MWFLRTPVHERAEAPPVTGYFTGLRKGLSYINKHDFLKVFFFFNALFLIFMGPMAFLTPLQVARSFGDEVWRLSALEVGFSFGMVLGGILIAWWGGFSNKLHSMAGATFVFGICTVILGVPPNFVVYIGLMAVVGIIIPLFKTPAITVDNKPLKRAGEPIDSA